MMTFLQQEKLAPAQCLPVGELFNKFYLASHTEIFQVSKEILIKLNIVFKLLTFISCTSLKA
jgi:hypothetical protein